MKYRIYENGDGEIEILEMKADKLEDTLCTCESMEDAEKVLRALNHHCSEPWCSCQDAEAEDGCCFCCGRMVDPGIAIDRAMDSLQDR